MQVAVKQTSPVENGLRKKLMEAINNLSYTEMKNLNKLLESPKAKKLLANSAKVALIT